MLLVKRKKMLKESDFGRNPGWYVVLHNENIAELINPEFEHGFWYSYDLIVLESAREKDLKCEDFWGTKDLRFLSKYMNEYVENEDLTFIVEPEHPLEIMVMNLDIKLNN